MPVFDDSNTTRKLSRYHLNSVGFVHVEECNDGQAALAKLEAARTQTKAAPPRLQRLLTEFERRFSGEKAR